MGPYPSSWFQRADLIKFFYAPKKLASLVAADQRYNASPSMLIKSANNDTHSKH